MRQARSLFLLAVVSASLSYAAQANYDAAQNLWTLSNGWIRALFQLTPDGLFLAQSITDLQSGDQWLASPNQPSAAVRLATANGTFDAQTQYALIDQYTQTTNPSGVRQFVVLQDLKSTAQITVIFDIYDNQPVLRYHVRYYNLTASTQYVTSVNMLPWTFADSGKRYTAFRVNQWTTETKPEDFEVLQSVLDLDGTAAEVYSGAHGQQCGWLAVRDTDMRGLFAGWEFDGRSKTTALQMGTPGYLDFSSSILDLNHPVASAADFSTPWAFIGLFHGDFDEAGYRTQRFVESVLAMRAPGASSGPYVSWDSWGYGQQIDEETLRRNAYIAAAMGVEIFIVDLGWARSIGDWYADPTKFPSGLDALSDYVHSLGMKFGLHFALTEADPASPVLQANPDWTSTEQDGYFGASSLCLSNQATSDWVVAQAIRMIDDYHVDWIVQDGENMVKQCTKTTHTHDPADSNYSNSVNGLNAVVSAIQAARPDVAWENCENGGNMMTFNMVKSYVTSITNDASGSLDSRRAAFGATFPFSPRFAERYMPQSDGLDPYATHSYRFGGNWALMNRLTDLSADQLTFLAQQVANYKAQRADIAAGKVFHILPPSLGGTDVIQSYNPATDSAIAVITRAQSDGPVYIFTPKGLNPDQRYTVWFEIDSSIYSLPGAQLMSNGVRVPLPNPFSSDVVHIQAQM
jgi:alpha-galactosidase